VIVVVGEALIDAHLDGEALRPHPGGGPFNTAVSLARLGTPCSFLGGISSDVLGQLLEQRLAAAGVDTGLLVRTDAPTPMALVDVGGAEASYSFYLEGTAYQALDAATLPALPDGATALHVGTLALATDPPADAVRALVEREAETCVIVVDPNVRPAVIADRGAYLSRLERVFAAADVVKLSTADLDWLRPGCSERDVAEELLAAGAGCVVVTRGPRGAAAWTAAAELEVDAPRVAVADTVGAGDAFGAGLMTALAADGLLSKKRLRALGTAELDRPLRYAAAVGALQCTRPSAWAPTAHDVDAFLAQRSLAPTVS
jgi:fructokinase